MPQAVSRRLVIVSNMAHYLRDGIVVGWGPTVQEISHLARLFEDIRHVACLHREPAPASALPYTSERVTLVPVPPAGGRRLRDKLGILAFAPHYLRAIARELPRADVVHVRAPANISLMAILLLSLVRRPRVRWIKYAGNWRPTGREPRSYAFQRWWLRKGLSRAWVTVNGEWPAQPSFVRSFLNPCLTEDDLQAGRETAAQKRLSSPVRLVFVGWLHSRKGVGRALQVAAELHRTGMGLTLDLVGDGPQRLEFERQANRLGIAPMARFHGWLPKDQVRPFLALSHFMLLPSESEGWPKVLSEGMAFGVVPLASPVGSIPQVLREIGAGRAIDADAIDLYADSIRRYVEAPGTWLTESRAAVEGASRFSYSRYLASVADLLQQNEPSRMRKRRS